MPTPEQEHLNQPVPCPDRKRENLHTAVDRALTTVERIHEQAESIRARLDLWRLIELLGVAVMCSVALGVYSFWQTAEPKPPAEASSGAMLLVLRLAAGLVPGAIIVLFAFRCVGRLKADYARDSTYVTYVADVLREGVTPDLFPTRLEWSVFKMRLYRFEIGDGRPFGERRDKDEPPARPLNQWPAGLEIPAPGEAKART